MSDDHVRPVTSLIDFSSGVGKRAFDRLVEFSKSQRFRKDMQAAYDVFWSAKFRHLDERAQSAALSRPEAESGFITYALLDAATAGGETIAELFLTLHGAHLAKREREYLQRLAGTRMGIYEVAAVTLDRELTLIELWNGERITVRERALTHDVQRGSVFAARTFPAFDGATELDGAVYSFSHPHGKALLANLRAEWRKQKSHFGSADAMFLKRCAAPAINRYWFDTIFLSPPSSLPGMIATVPQDALSDQQMMELTALLESPTASDAMDLSQLDGFLCAIACGPEMVSPGAWLPLVWGDTPPAFASDEHTARIIGLLFQLSNHIGRTIADGTFIPLLPDVAPEGLESVAELWCLGFAQGVGLSSSAWEPLLTDPLSHMFVLPILALASPSDFIDELAAMPSEIAGVVSILPQTVQFIAAYWRGEIARPPKPARPKTSKAPAPASASTMHRLKIQLAGVKPPVWRRILIESNAKLPFVSRVLLTSMGWTDTHLHEFAVGRVSYGVRDPDFQSDVRSERSVTLAQIAPNVKDHFLFDYDFGDGWRHRVTVEEIVESTDDAFPTCIAGVRSCPPEDCGGPYGYADLLEALADPAHEEHERLKEWVGEYFEPNTFDRVQTNRDLRTIAQRQRRSKRATNV